MPKQNSTSPGVKRRAERIIRNPETDPSTREAIRYNLDTNDPDLPELVRRAEKGDTIIDTVSDADAEEVAATILVDFLNRSGPPDWLTDEIQNILEEAAARERINLWKPEGDSEVYDPKSLTHLFALTRFYRLRTPRAHLALAIHEILTNDETPATLFNAVADFVSVASSGDTMQTFWTPPILEHMLEWSKTHSLDAMREKGQLNDETEKANQASA